MNVHPTKCSNGSAVEGHPRGRGSGGPSRDECPAQRRRGAGEDEAADPDRDQPDEQAQGKRGSARLEFRRAGSPGDRPAVDPQGQVERDDQRRRLQDPGGPEVRLLVEHPLAVDGDDARDQQGDPPDDGRLVVEAGEQPGSVPSNRSAVYGAVNGIPIASDPKATIVSATFETASA